MTNEQQIFTKKRILVVAGTLDNKSVMSNTKKLIEILSPFSSTIILYTICKNFQSQNNTIKDTRFLFSYEQFLLGYFYNQLFIVWGILENRLKGQLHFVFFAFNHDLDILPILLCKILGIPVIVRSDGRNSLFVKYYSEQQRSGSYYFYKILEEIDYILADLLLTESEYMINFYNFDKFNHVAVGNLFVDLQKFRITTPHNSKKYTLGFVGRFSQEKGILEFAQAIILLLKSFEFKAIIVGEGELNDSLKKLLTENPIESNNIELRFWVENDQLPDLLNDISILVIPSKKEGLPNIILEAMACGTVVLATNVGGIPGIIQDRETGFLMEINSPECIVRNVMRVLNNQNLDSIINQAKEVIEQEYSLDNAQNNLNDALIRFHIN